MGSAGGVPRARPGQVGVEATVERTIDVGEGARGVVSVADPVLRYTGNPILTCVDVNRAWQDPRLRVVTVHNAGAAVVDGESALLFRSHLRCGMSILGVARSNDGVRDWRVDPRPALIPATPNDLFGPDVDVDLVVEMESGGVEDARLNRVDQTIAVTYSAYHAEVRNRVRVALATTDDLRGFRRQGPMLDQDMRNVVLFPGRVAGRYLGLFRPNDTCLLYTSDAADDVLCVDLGARRIFKTTK